MMSDFRIQVGRLVRGPRQACFPGTNRLQTTHTAPNKPSRGLQTSVGQAWRSGARGRRRQGNQFIRTETSLDTPASSMVTP